MGILIRVSKIYLVKREYVVIICRSKNYTDEYREMIMVVYDSEITVTQISSEYGIVKSTINEWIKFNQKVKVSDDEFIFIKEIGTLKKEFARIKEKNEILKKAMVIFAKET